MHTVLPPEQVVPEHFTDPTFLRADFTGVTLNLDRWNPKAPMPLPKLVGANTTPLAMLMSPMLPLYPRYWQDAYLTESAERGLDDFVISPEPWNAAENGYTITIDKTVAWARYVESWGFRPVIWRGPATLGLDAMLQALLDAGLVSFYLHGKEVDQQMPSEAYEASLQAIDQHLNGKIPIGVHFSADDGRKMGYPIGFPRDTFLQDWSRYDGRVHLCWQGHPDASAGLMGASLYYARQHVNAGIGDAARGPGAPNSRVIAFEVRATAQLYGRCDEDHGNLIDWELLCTTRTDPRVRAVSGFGNGARRPDGTPI